MPWSEVGFATAGHVAQIAYDAPLADPFMDDATLKPRLTLRIARFMAWSIVSLTAIAIGAWLVGRVISDRHAWSQWLLWIPTPAALCAGVVGMVALFAAVRAHRRRRMLLGTWGIGVLAMFIFFGAIEYRLYRVSPLDGEGIRIVHWSMSHTKEPFLPQAQTILDQEPDLAILNDAWRAADPAFQAWAERINGVSTRSDRFTILSKLPIIEKRILVKNERTVIALLRLDGTQALGRELTILLVDLPSSPRESRWEIAQRARTLMAEANAPPPDIVIGDLNITRNSASLDAFFPSLHHAYDDAGGGYAASFRREFPLYHIDHVLLDDSLRATSYRLVDPGVGRHRMQVATVANR